METRVIGQLLARADARICQTLARIKDLLVPESTVAHGLEREFQWMERQFGRVLAMLRVAVVRIGSGSVSVEEYGALEEFVYHVLEFDRSANSCFDTIIYRREHSTYFSSKEMSRATDMDMLFIEALIQGVTKRASRLSLTDAKTLFTPDVDIGQEEEPMVGLEEDVQVVTSTLIGNKVSVRAIAIVGAERIGKTTLARKVYNNSAIACHFSCRAWVTMPREFEPSSVLLYTAKQVLLGFEQMKKEWSMTVEEARKRLRHFLRYKRYLIVLDDVLTPEAWITLLNLFPNTSNGSRIMITTRSRDLVNNGSDWYIHEKRALSDEQGWELFNAKLGFPIRGEMETLARETVNKCLGFPATILAVGDLLLSNKATTEEQWSSLLEQFHREQTPLYHVLDSAADALATNLKQCLLYFGFFNENYEIPARRLIALWVAEGLMQLKNDDIEPPECVAEKLLVELVQRNMIQVARWKLNGKVKTCRMNYLLRDKWLSKNASFFHNSKVATTESSRGTGMNLILRLADHLDKKDECFSHIHGNDTISRSSFKSLYGHLHTFLSFDSREGPVPGEDIGSFLCRGIYWSCFKMLRVVDLEGVFRPKLTNSIGKLIQLRYLGLRRTLIEILPSLIGNLLNLQTLDLKHTCIRSLPYSVWKMQQLRHLYLSESYRSRILAPPSTSSLPDIQTLWGPFVDEVTQVEGGLDRLINLRKLGLVCRLTLSQQKALAEWVAKLNHLESLRLRSIDAMVRPSNLYLKPLSGLYKLSSIYLLGRLENPIVVHEFPESLTEITLSVSGLLEDPMPKLEKLPNIRILNLYSGSYTGKIMVCSSGGFPLHRILNLWKLEELEEWIVEEGALTILRDLEIRFCNKLKMIPDGLKHLVHCRELKLTNMPDKFKERVIEGQGEDWHKVSHVPSVTIKG